MPRVYALLLILAAPLAAQQQDLASRLIGRPLYLREAWIGDRIAFDATGRPTSETPRGPLTLSGVEITSARVSGHTLTLHGLRVVLVAPTPGAPLIRVSSINSITMMPMTTQKQYVAKENVQFTVAADADGQFTTALDAIFADGLAQLRPSVPPFWRCYAQTYFVDTPIPTAAADDVLHCALSQSQIPRSGDFIAPQALQTVSPHYPRQAAELRVSGTSIVYVTIDAQAHPSDFQVVSAVGAGLDESVLDAVAHFTYRPATQDGTPTKAGFQFSMNFGKQ